MNAVLAAIRARLRFSLASRLAISFVGVAGLILAANLIVQQGIVVERTTRLIPAAPATKVVLVPAPAPVQVTAPQPVPAVSPVLLEDTFGALGRWEHAGQMRLKDASPSALAQYRQAAARFDTAVNAVLSASAAEHADSAFSRIRSESRAYGAQAAALLQTSDARRTAETERIALLERIDVRVKEPLASAWTIFGRVVSRQTLVQLSDDLDSVRQHSELLDAGNALSSVQVAAISAAEQRLQKTLLDNQVAFRRGQGEAW
jgi:hypothetical protein